MVSLRLASFVDPIRDIYEAFTIYTFFQLLINYLGGERALIIMTHGREPVPHLWPLNHVLPPVDISDPHTFLAIKRGILQYAWLKPVLSLAAIIMKATGVYQEGYIGLSSGYFWSGIVYNISVTLSLYSLGLFWVCMHEDLKPFRPVPKFLCIKLIIFASYWQGFFLSILVWLGAISDNVEGYTPDNLAAAIQDALICIEMPAFAVAHWYAFSWQDFENKTVQSARMPVLYALRDSFGIRDLIQDSRETFQGDKYRYRYFDSTHNIIAHESSRSRFERLKEGMRYERGGKAKYWIPKPGEIATSSIPSVHTPLLGGSNGESSRQDGLAEHEVSSSTFDEPHLDDDEESLYGKARELEFGDWNVSVGVDVCPAVHIANRFQYPVITDSQPLRDRYPSSTSSLGRASPAQPVVRKTPTQRRSGEGEVVAVKKKRKKKVVQEPESEPSAEASGSKKPDEEPVASEATPSGINPQVYRQPSDSPGIQEARQWGKEPESDHQGGSPFAVGDDEEFDNVWGEGGQTDGRDS